ncbi:hypothetical protein [Streptomyces acidicola]|uniref:hypothetical protein n=1 Tax=Streptomyces acidicola TaxID=2596892 RepID=UPI00342370E4
MSTRTTFEDRLLGELKREIELREAGVRETEPMVEAGTDKLKAHASIRRVLSRLTPRRITVVAAACAAAWLGMAVVPGSPADSTAYAVERHGDGSVTLTIKDQNIGVEAQRELARKVRPWGIVVTVDVLPLRYVCDRSKVTAAIAAVDQRGNLVPVLPIEAAWDVTLRRGNVLAFENTRGGSAPRAVKFYETRREAEPCVPRKIALPDDQPTD